MAYPLIGKETIEIDWKNFTRGMSTSDYTSDAGFSVGTSVSTGAASYVNPLVNPGALSFPASPTDKSTNVADSVIASSPDPSATYNRLFVGDAGKFYGWNGTTMTLVATDSTRSYVAGKTDIAPYGSYAYGTSATQIFEWQPSSATINQSFLSGGFVGSSGSATWVAANVPHPVLNFEGNIYYGNGPQLLRQTAVGAQPSEILLLQNFGETIVALGIDPGSGKMLISYTSGQNLSGTLPNINKVGYYDGFSNKLLKSVIVDDMITAFYPVGATVFTTYAQNLGYWTGAGIQFLRTLLISLNNTELAYKHHLTNIDEILYVVERQNILAYGQVMRGAAKAFWYALGNYPGGNATNLSIITNLGSNVLGYSYATNKFATLDTSSTTSLGGNAEFYSQNYNVPRVTAFAQIIIQFISPIPTNTQMGSMAIIDENGVITNIGSVQTEQTGVSWVALPWQSLTQRQIQLRYIPILNTPVFRITIFHTPQ